MFADFLMGYYSKMEQLDLSLFLYQIGYYSRTYIDIPFSSLKF